MKISLLKKVFFFLTGFVMLLGTSHAVFADAVPEPYPVSNINTLLIIGGIVLIAAVASVLIISAIRKKNGN